MKSLQLSQPFSLKSRRSGEAGFTMIELLVVIIIIGILAAIAWPAFLTQAAKAKQAKAVMALGAINRAQQAYRLENPSFADSLASLGASITNNQEYTYTISMTQPGYTTAQASPQDPLLRGYAGITYSFLNGSDIVTTTLLCEGEKGIIPSLTVTENLSQTLVSGCHGI